MASVKCCWLVAHPQGRDFDDDDREGPGVCGSAFAFCPEPAVETEDATITAFCPAHSVASVERRAMLMSEDTVEAKIEMLRMWPAYGFDCACGSVNCSFDPRSTNEDLAICGTCERVFVANHVDLHVRDSALTYCSTCRFMKLLDDDHWLVVQVVSPQVVVPMAATGTLPPPVPVSSLSLAADLASALKALVPKRKSSDKDSDDDDDAAADVNGRVKVPKKMSPDSNGEFYLGIERSKEAKKIGKIHKSHSMPISESLASLCIQFNLSLSADEDYPFPPANLEQVYNFLEQQCLRLASWGHPDTGVKDQTERARWFWSSVHSGECVVQMRVVQREAVDGDTAQLLAFFYGKRFITMRAVADAVGVAFGEAVDPAILRIAEKDVESFTKGRFGRASVSQASPLIARKPCFHCKSTEHYSRRCPSKLTPVKSPKKKKEREDSSDSDDEPKKERKSKKSKKDKKDK